MASQTPADLDLHCFQNRIYLSLIWYGIFQMSRLNAAIDLLP